MPLVDPVTMSTKKDTDDHKPAATTEDPHTTAVDASSLEPPSEEAKSEWLTKLMGKTVSDEDHNEINFAKRDLPKESRVIKPGQMVTRDWKPHRMNVHVDEKEVVMNVTYG